MGTLYHTMTLPARLLIDGVGGGDVVFRELAYGDFLGTDAADRVSASLYSFRGALVPSGAAREEWLRALPSAAGRLFAEAVKRLHMPTEAQRKAFEASRTFVDGVYRWTLPVDLGGEVVEMREMSFGQVEDTLAAVRAAKGRLAAVALAAAAIGKPVESVHAGSCRVGALVLWAYNDIHSVSDEEEESFFGGASESTTPPKAI